MKSWCEEETGFGQVNRGYANLDFTSYLYRPAYAYYLM
ncbi:hypothetical protein BMG_5943 (plasmid) [Priestia megaterium]|nr:hypothetical protein BMG_5943 [Priestia megaterium]